MLRMTTRAFGGGMRTAHRVVIAGIPNQKAYSSSTEAWTADAMERNPEMWQLHLNSSQREALLEAAGELQHRGVALEVCKRSYYSTSPSIIIFHSYLTSRALRYIRCTRASALGNHCR